MVIAGDGGPQVPASSVSQAARRLPVPVIGVCGYSNSGKTLLLERLVPRLTGRGLRVALIKDSHHPLDVDRSGKDSDRLFAVGADVLVCGADQTFIRLHAARLTLDECLARLPGGYDLVLVEGFRNVALPKIRLDDEPDDQLLARLTDGHPDIDAAEQAIWDYLTHLRRSGGSDSITPR
ncbi:MAG: molybdopterin-guanine dinucleotide biosynthesis protein B [Armatimonadetes bacterium]|nr:molybdopterin-guanine dinucleotide biosynthesis protein B [Armatimonadota bacterium]